LNPHPPKKPLYLKTLYDINSPHAFSYCEEPPPPPTIKEAFSAETLKLGPTEGQTRGINRTGKMEKKKKKQIIWRIYGSNPTLRRLANWMFINIGTD